MIWKHILLSISISSRAIQTHLQLIQYNKFLTSPSSEPSFMYYYSQSLNIIQISKVVKVRSSMSSSRRQVDRSEQIIEAKNAIFQKIKKILDPQYFARRQIAKQIDLAKKNMASNQWQQRLNQQLLSLYQRRQVFMEQPKPQPSPDLQVYSSQPRQDQNSRQNLPSQAYEQHELSDFVRTHRSQEWAQRFMNTHQSQYRNKYKSSIHLRHTDLEDLQDTFKRLKSEKQAALSQVEVLRYQKEKDTREICELTKTKFQIIEEKQLQRLDSQEIKRKKEQLEQKNKTLQEKLQQQQEAKIKIEGEKKRLQIENSQLKQANAKLESGNTLFRELFFTQQEESIKTKSQVLKLNHENLILFLANKNLRSDNQAFKESHREQMAESQKAKQQLRQQKDKVRQDAYQKGILLLQCNQKIENLQEQLKRKEERQAQNDKQIEKLKAHIQDLQSGNA